MTDRQLVMMEYATVAHVLVSAGLTRCGLWNLWWQRIASVPDGCRMCKSCTRLAGEADG